MRLATLCVAGLLIVPAMAGESAPSSEIVGGLRRGPFLGAAVGRAEGGLEVRGVGPGTTAEKMGLQPGDRLVSVDGQAVTDAAAFVATIGKKRVGRGREDRRPPWRGEPHPHGDAHRPAAGAAGRLRRRVRQRGGGRGRREAAHHSHPAPGRGKASGGAPDGRDRLLLAGWNPASGRAPRRVRQAAGRLDPGRVRHDAGGEDRDG
jgi:hypothetical protein